ncbi:MAG: hypothetical protein OEX07_14800 [Gammaproteobacteria bacterium]|nr:hypothetical protein [Gammaproteobacteria bacterium]
MKKKLPIIIFFCICAVYSAATFALDEKEKQPVADFLSKLRMSYAQINDYSATMRLESFENEYQLQRQKMWFKKPGYLLLRQLGPFKKGAALAILPNGQIKGHLGGFLSFAVVSLDKDDENMYGVTHDSALSTDYDKILDIATDMLDRVIDYSIETVSIDNKKRLVLTTSYDQKFDRFRLIVDPASMLIIGLERYTKGKLIHKIQWFDIKTNINIDTDKFNL